MPQAIADKSVTDKRIITPEAILSYPFLIQPRVGPNGEAARYSCVLVFSPGDHLQPLYNLVYAVGRDKWGPKFDEGLKAGKFRWPFRTDTDKNYSDEGDKVFLNAKCENQPTLVDCYGTERNAQGKLIPRVIKDEAEIREKFYPGARVLASLTAHAYDKQMNKGVSFFLNHLQWRADGQRLDTRRRAVDEFEAIEGPSAEMI